MTFNTKFASFKKVNKCFILLTFPNVFFETLFVLLCIVASLEMSQKNPDNSIFSFILNCFKSHSFDCWLLLLHPSFLLSRFRIANEFFSSSISVPTAGSFSISFFRKIIFFCRSTRSKFRILNNVFYITYKTNGHRFFNGICVKICSLVEIIMFLRKIMMQFFFY